MKTILPIFIIFILLFQSCNKDNDAPSSFNTTFKVPATEDIIMYEINIGSFSSQRNLAGITARLDEIEALGINTIWLMPIHPIGTLNSFGSPYCIKDFKAVNPQIGNIDNLKELVAEAHKRKMAVILDWVANHTAWDHPWISEHPNWYTQNASGDIVHPPGTNWTDVADLNFNNAEMRLEMIAAMEFWIKEADIDGFRCDAADLVPFDFWQQATTSLKNKSGKNLILLAEGSRDDHFEAGFDMNFAWDWYNSLKNVIAAFANPQLLYTTNSNENSSVPPGKKKLRFTTNHDLSNELTPPDVFNTQQGALAAFVATVFMDAVPLIYSGQEVGVNQSSIYMTGQAINWNLNPDILAEYTKILQFYKSSAMAKKGLISYFSDLDFIVFQKTLGNSKLLVIINRRNFEQNLSVPSSLLGSWENTLNKQTFSLSENLQLAGYNYLILQRF